MYLHAQRTGKPVTHLDPEAVEALAAYDWPGNIRELENVLERAVVLADGPAVTLEDLPAELRQGGRRGQRPRLPAPTRSRAGRARSTSTLPSRSSTAAGRGATPAQALPAPDDPDLADGELDGESESEERRKLLDALDEAFGNKSIAARILGMPRSTFFSKLRKHGIEKARPDRDNSGTAE
jgi:DNA-binding NtrC family response regulator